MPSGQPSRVFREVNSAIWQPAWRSPSCFSEVSQALSGSLAIADSSSGVIFQPTV
ncbi:hypothetical protein [Streptomyces mirabilis]|uniref:hypothetical protein n=1 Tax=Streptomyces mirabilis TaxID=68239 RepID=UPI0037FE2A3A